MNNKEIAQKILGYNREIFESVYSTLTTAQEEQQKAAEQVLEKVTFIPEGGRTFAEKYYKAAKEIRKNFREVVLKGHEQVENYFTLAC